VRLSTADGSAKAGVDYLPQTEGLNFAPFETEKHVPLRLTGITNRDSRVFFLSLRDPTGAALSEQPPFPILIGGIALPPGKITPLRMPNGGVALVFGELPFQSESSSSLVEVSADMKTWLPSAGYRMAYDWKSGPAVVWIDNHSRFEVPRFYRVRELHP